MRPFNRREFLAVSAKLGAAGAVWRIMPPFASSPARAAPVLDETQRRTLDAALARMIPAEGPGDWSAADVGAGDYIETLLSGTDRIYAGGPDRAGFHAFQAPSAAKQAGWQMEIERLRALYAAGLKDLDARSPGGSFADELPAVQDAILARLDMDGSPFFAALYRHTMEGVYSHPVYGGNKDYRAWSDLAYAGDVHGVRFPNIGDPGASWNVYGGYAPEEMIRPGESGA